MGRPVNWAPLAESDPIPGEPEAISGEARRLRDMAVEMRSQISRLRSIGDDDNQGLYADTLRTAASDLRCRSRPQTTWIRGCWLPGWSPTVRRPARWSWRVQRRPERNT